MNFAIIFGFVVLITSSLASGIRVPAYPIPKPQSFRPSLGKPPLTILPSKFRIIPTGAKCDILSHAVDRYATILIRQGEDAGGRAADAPKKSKHDKTTKQLCEQNKETVTLSKLSINVETRCDGRIYPKETSNEHYSLKIDAFEAVLTAKEIWGALRGLETFSQLVFKNRMTHCLQLTQAQIEDFPRYKHRGFMLDTARHFIPIEIILLNLDAMSYAKFNIFHWHMTDRPSFPYESTTYPILSAKGAFSPTEVYSQADVAKIIEAARLRGIRVIPEFDTPGHSNSWFSLPHFLCDGNGREAPPSFNNIVDPSQDVTFEYLKNLHQEWKTVFPDKYSHLGGDEEYVSPCWNTNPHIVAFKKKHGFESNTDLQRFYFEKLQNIVKDQDKVSMVWQDPFFYRNSNLEKNTVIQIYGGDNISARSKMLNYLQKVAERGYKQVLSSCWYINDWRDTKSYTEKYYLCDPEDFKGTEKQHELVLGGEACNWNIHSSQVLSTSWPLAAAIGERFWSARDVKDTDDMFNRLSEMRCRLINRGISAGFFSGLGNCNKE